MPTKSRKVKRSTSKRSTAARRPKAAPKNSDKRSLDQLATMLGIETSDDFIERAFRYDPGSEEAETEAYHNYHNALMHVAENLFELHGLILAPVHFPRSDKRYPTEFQIAPEKSWDVAARKLLTTINGVGDISFSSLKDFLDSGPYTARQAVLSHLGYIGRYPDVYGTPNAERQFERYLR